jgi:hypothetical protein
MVINDEITAVSESLNLSRSLWEKRSEHRRTYQRKE